MVVYYLSELYYMVFSGMAFHIGHHVALSHHLCDTVTYTGYYCIGAWTVLAADAKRLEAFHMKCQRQIMKIRWQDHIRITEVASLTGLCPVLDLIMRRRNVVFGHNC